MFQEKIRTDLINEWSFGNLGEEQIGTIFRNLYWITEFVRETNQKAFKKHT